MSNLPSVVVKPSRQFPFLSRHPWVHVRSLADTAETFPLGQEVDLVQHDGTWLARGLFNPNSGLRVRLYTWDRDQNLDDAFFGQRLDEAIARRRLAGFLDSPNEQGTVEGVTSAARLVFSESDGLSGLIVDQYADCLVVQIAAGAIAARQTALLDHLQNRLQPRAIFLRTDAKTAKKEGIDQQEGLARGQAPSESTLYEQNGIQLSVDLEHGQKTGAYLDQRDNHAVAAKYLVGRRVLDMCCYAGGFGLVAAARGAAHITAVDSSDRALELAAANAQRNGLQQFTFEKADCFDYFAKGDPPMFDAVVLDPPRFAGSRRQVDAAIRAYAKLNRGAIDRLPPGGILVTNSCSGSVSRSDFLNMLVDVGRRAQRDVIVLESRSAAADHPMRVSCPETDYLKCFICEVR